MELVRTLPDRSPSRFRLRHEHSREGAVKFLLMLEFILTPAADFLLSIIVNDGCAVIVLWEYGGGVFVYFSR